MAGGEWVDPEADLVQIFKGLSVRGKAYPPPLGGAVVGLT